MRKLLCTFVAIALMATGAAYTFITIPNFEFVPGRMFIIGPFVTLAGFLTFASEWFDL
jgi:hypothetical protein